MTTDQAASETKHREHPTRKRLVDTVLELFEVHPHGSVTADMVLSASGVSKGSLYHHFEDFDDLLGTAMAREFSRAVQDTIDQARIGFASCESSDGLQGLIRELHRYSQTPLMKRRRLERIRLIVFSQGQPRLRALLAAEQTRLTDAFEELFATARANGWIRQDIAPRAAAVLVQAYTIGRLVDDIAESPLDDEAWFRMVDLLAERVFGPSP
jgi:AcrR family transcriptional regulator